MPSVFQRDSQGKHCIREGGCSAKEECCSNKCYNNERNTAWGIPGTCVFWEIADETSDS